jgi:hypothetical protein
MSPLAFIGIGELGVSADVGRDVVIVDRAGDEPLIGNPAVRSSLDAPKPPIGDRLEGIRDGQHHPLAVRLVDLGILSGPPDAGAQSLAGGGDPGASIGVPGPDEPSIPGRPLSDPRLSAVVDPEGPVRPLLLTGGGQEEGVPLPPKPQLSPVLHHAVDVERLLEVDLHSARLADHAVSNPVPAANRAVGGIKPHVQIVKGHVPPGALRRD